jgi:hypothetical protein
MYEDQIERALGVFEHKNNVREHFHCVKSIFDMYKTHEQLSALAKRPDIDTVCAFDYVRMKNFALKGDGLKYEDYHPEIKGIKIPQL